MVRQKFLPGSTSIETQESHPLLEIEKASMSLAIVTWPVDIVEAYINPENTHLNVLLNFKYFSMDSRSWPKFLLLFF